MTALPSYEFTAEQLLICSRLEKTTQAGICIQAEERGYFTEFDKNYVKVMWPRDDQYTEAVLNDNIMCATLRLIAIEAGLADQALKRYRFKKKR